MDGSGGDSDDIETVEPESVNGDEEILDDSIIMTYVKDVLLRMKQGEFNRQIAQGNPWILPGDPVYENRKLMASGMLPSPELFYLPRSFISPRYSFLAST